MFGIHSLSPEVEQILKQTRLLPLLVCDLEKVRAVPVAESRARSLTPHDVQAGGLEMQIYELDTAATLQCEVMGDSRPLFDSTYSEDHCRTVKFSNESFAIGLGALGDDFSAVHHQFGEFLAVAGAVAVTPSSRRQLPDYSFSREDFVPQANVLYGIRCAGKFSQLIRFRSIEFPEPVGLSTVIAQCLQQSRCDSAGIVLLAETAGLLGAHLRRSPAAAAVMAVQRFEFPEIRNWLSFSPERVYSRNLALIVGVSKVSKSAGPSSPVDPLLRPMTTDGGLQGHFHAAVFPYRPLKKRSLDFHESIREQFDSGMIQDVLHLLRDDRPTLGVGESELLGGACWVSPLREVVTMEGNG
jgi:hypothetical protein